jgi:hypothetical protein
MGTFQSFIQDKGIKPEDLVSVSFNRERLGNDGRKLLTLRAQKRRSTENKDKKYAELNLAKPTAGRGVSLQQVTAAINGKPQPKKVRSKLFKAVNEVLKGKKQPAVTDFKLLFEGAEMKKGKAPKTAAAKK